VLALHGWLDNAGTWDKLAPLLIRSSPGPFYPVTCALPSDLFDLVPMTIVCMDFLGHGRSEHRGDSYYTHLGHTHDVIDVIDQLRWKHCVILVHLFDHL